MAGQSDWKKSDWRSLTTMKAGLERAVWESPLDAMPWWRRRGFMAVRMVLALHRDMVDGALPMRAMSLVYTTLLSLVPLLAISFSVLKGFGVHNQIEPFLLGLFEPLGDKAAEITGKIVAFVDNMRVGVLGGLGFAMLFYTVMSLLQKIERAFNYVWHVRRDRNLGQRFRDYLSVVIVGPALVFSALGLTAGSASGVIADLVSGLGPVKLLIELAGRLVPYVMIVGAFTFIYSFMPNTKVKLRSALLGGLVAGVLWTTAGWLFASFVAGSANYTAVYSTFASLIVLLMWLYVGWLILLIGATIAFYHQYPEHLVAGHDGLPSSPRVAERIGLLVVHHVVRRFYQGGRSLTADEIAHRIGLPPHLVEDCLGLLCARGLLAAQNTDPAGYLPARPPEATPVRELLDVLRAGADSLVHRAMTIGPALAKDARVGTVIDIADLVDRAALAAVTDMTLKDLAGTVAPGPTEGPASNPVESQAT